MGKRAAGSAAKAQGKSKIVKRETTIGKSEFSANCDHYKDVAEAMDKILSHEVFENCLNRMPIDIANGGSEATFDQKQFEAAIGKTGRYKSAGNIWWINTLKGSGFNRVPVNPASIVLLQSHYFERPSPFPEPIVIAVGTGDKPLEMKGRLERVSPEEMEHALILKIANRIDNGCPRQELEEWRKVCLTVSIVFLLIDNATDRMWKSVALRESLSANYTSMSRSALQRIWEIVECRQMYEKSTGSINNNRLAELFNQKVQMSPTSEPVTPGLVGMAMQTYNRLLKIEPACSIIQLADETWMKLSPFNSITKLSLIASKAVNSNMAVWLLSSIVDNIHNGQSAPTDYTARSLSEPRGRGLLAFFELKSDLKKFLLDEWLEKYKFSPAAKSLIRQSMESHSVFRCHFGFPGDDDIDLSWQAGWTAAESLACRFIGDAIYGTAHDPTIKQGMRNGKSSDELLGIATLQESVSAIDDIQHKILEEAGRDNRESKTEKSEDVEGGDSEVLQPVGKKSTLNRQAEFNADIVMGGVEKMSDNRKSAIEKFKSRANEIVRAGVVFLSDADLNSSSKVKQAIDNSFLGAKKPDENRNIIVLYDIKTGGEAITSPSCIRPSFRQSHYKKMVQSFLALGESNEGIPEGYIFVIFDSFKPGLERDILTAFTKSPVENQKSPEAMLRSHQKLGIVYSEEAVRERKEKTRGIASIAQLETVHFVSLTGLPSKPKDRLHYSGTTAGSLLVNVGMPIESSLWHESVAVKKQIFGDSRMAVGGGRPGDDGQPKAIRQSTDMEPVFYHSMIDNLISEILHVASSRKPALVIDLTPGEGAAVRVCLENRIPIIAICHTDAHVKGLKSWSTNRIFHMMQDEGSSFYEVELGAALIDDLVDESVATPAKTTKPKQKAKAKCKSVKSAKPKPESTVADPVKAEEEEGMDEEVSEDKDEPSEDS